jgi:hypothetical protein
VLVTGGILTALIAIAGITLVMRSGASSRARTE